MMLYKIIWKNYKSHLKNYIAFFACSICNVALFFAFWAIQNTFGKNPDMNESAYFQYDMLGDYLVTGILITVLTVSMLLFSQKNYIRFRLKDYQLFLVLGMTKKKFLRLFLIEYILNWGVSFLLGLAAGQGIFQGITAVLGTAAGEETGYQPVAKEVYRNTFLTVILLMVIVFLALMTWMEGKEPGEFIRSSERGEKRPAQRKWLWIAGVGTAVCFLAFFLFRQGGWGWIWAHPVWVLGSMLILVPAGGVFLEWLRKQKFYYQNLPWLNPLYHKYLNNMLLILVLFSVHFTVLGYAANQVALRLPVEPNRTLWTWDYVWMGREENQDSAQKTAEKYGGTLTSVPMMRVVSTTFDEQIGIPASVYGGLTGEEINLEGREILVSLPGQRTKERCYLDEEKGERYRHLMTGKYTEELRAEFFPFTSSGNYTEEMTYDVTAVVSENLFGDYTRSIAQIGFFRGSGVENVIVFSDAYFQEQWKRLSEDKEEPSRLLLFQIPENQREEAAKELSSYAEDTGIQDFTGCQTFYDTDKVVEEIAAGKLFALIFVILSAVDIFLCAVLIYGLRLLSDYEGTARRYELLNSLGMEQKEQKKSIHMETVGDMRIALGAAVCMAGIYSLCNYRVFTENGHNPGSRFWLMWLAIAAGYILINGLATAAYAQYMQYLLVGRRETL